jgi:hypothetical protein
MEHFIKPGTTNIVPHVITKTLDKVIITLSNLEFNVSATFQADSFEDNGALFKRDVVVMAGEDYNRWLNDDEYAIEFVLTKLGYTKA